MASYRFPDVYLLTRILEVLDSNGPMTKTNVQMLSRINYSAFVRYFNMMIRLGVIERTHEHDAELIKLSAKGKQFHSKLSPLIQELKLAR